MFCRCGFLCMFFCNRSFCNLCTLLCFGLTGILLYFCCFTRPLSNPDAKGCILSISDGDTSLDVGGSLPVPVSVIDTGMVRFLFYLSILLRTLLFIPLAKK